MALRNSHRRRRKRHGSPPAPNATEDLNPAQEAVEEDDSRAGTEWEPFDLSPEEIARIAMQGPPKKNWRYLQEQ